MAIPAEAGTQGTLDTGESRCDQGPATEQGAIALGMLSRQMAPGAGRCGWCWAETLAGQYLQEPNAGFFNFLLMPAAARFALGLVAGLFMAGFGPWMLAASQRLHLGAAVGPYNVCSRPNGYIARISSVVPQLYPYGIGRGGGTGGAAEDTRTIPVTLECR